MKHNGFGDESMQIKRAGNRGSSKQLLSSRDILRKDFVMRIAFSYNGNLKLS
jgi:hypothetical protein